MEYTKAQLERFITILFEYVEVQKECINLLEDNNKLLKELNDMLREDNERLTAFAKFYFRFVALFILQIGNSPKFSLFV